MKSVVLVFLAVSLLALGALVRGCSGPRPRLVSSRMRGQVAEAMVRNDGFGEGEIQVDFRVRPRAGGPPLLRSERATLRPHETARVATRIEGARGDEELEVEVDYPAR
jgi:hypothetical protein